MADIITTLHPENNPSDNLYPNIKQANIPNLSIDTDRLAYESVTNSRIKDADIDGNAKLRDLSVTTNKINDDAINSSKIADDSIYTNHIVDGNVTTGKIGDSNVTTAKIADYNVTTAKLAYESVTNSRIKDADIDGNAKLRDLSVTTNKINDDAINSSKIADNSIFTNHIVDGNVATAKIADNAVTNAKLGYHSVDVTKLDDGCIQTSKILDKQVTGAKIADYTIDETKVKFFSYDDYVKGSYSFSGKTAVFFGDSITIGTASAPTPYPDYFCNKVNMTLTANYAIGGYGWGVSGNQVLTQLQNATEKTTDYVFIACGINDYLSGVTIDTLKTKVTEALTYALANYTGDIIIITPIKDNLSFDMSIALQLYRNTITECAITSDTTDRITVVQGNKFNFPNKNASDDYKTLMFVDTLHPTDYGYQTAYLYGLLKALK